jgi:para-nitrobenzyl esterase
VRRWLLILGLAAMAAPANSQAIRVEGGLVVGTTGSNPSIRVYRGVPYAAPPLGNLRWRVPQPAARWEGVRKAGQYSPTCMQPERSNDSVFSPGYEPDSEDCLYLNVWTSAKSARDRLPVMVWIHGGGFRFVSGSEKFFNGEKLAAKGAIVVTFNYRLGAFGFLAHPELSKESDHRTSGNYGVLDQIAALRWVQKNIAAFGGDPKRVTIFGQSAGANSVCYLLASPLTKGLYVRAIGESVVGCFGPSAEISKLDIAEKAGMKFLSAANAQSIADLRAKPAGELLKINGEYPFRPLVDGYVLPSNPHTIFSRGEENQVPILVGSNGDEGTLLGRPPASAAAFIAQARLQYGERADSFLKLFPANSDAQAVESNYLLWRDEVAVQARELSELMTHNGKVKAYRYYFSRKPPIPNGMYREQARHELGAYHSAEIEYVFENLDTRPYLWTDIDRNLAEKMSSYWVNFAKTGNPNGPALPNWPAADAEHDVLMEFGETDEVCHDFDKAALDFLSSFLAKQESLGATVSLGGSKTGD